MLVGLDILTGLMALIIVTGIFLAFIVPPLDGYIGRLPEASKLKKWWKHSVVGDGK